jgi:hypothetical protein
MRLRDQRWWGREQAPSEPLSHEPPDVLIDDAGFRGA